eukprot:1269716-Amphidinium_carterae.1
MHCVFGDNRSNSHRCLAVRQHTWKLSELTVLRLVVSGSRGRALGALEKLLANLWKTQRLSIKTSIHVIFFGKRLESQPYDTLVCFWYAACVRTLVCRTLAAALPAAQEEQERVRPLDAKRDSRLPPGAPWHRARITRIPVPGESWEDRLIRQRRWIFAGQNPWGLGSSACQ